MLFNDTLKNIKKTNVDMEEVVSEENSETNSSKSVESDSDTDSELHNEKPTTIFKAKGSLLKLDKNDMSSFKPEGTDVRLIFVKGRKKFKLLVSKGLETKDDSKRIN